MNTIVVLVVTVCLGAGDDSQCEDFGIKSWQGANAMQECRQEMEQEVKYSIMQGTVQTWKCVDVTGQEEKAI